MPKRTASDALSNGHADQPFNKMPPTGIRRETHSIDEMGEFEDAWEDEIESDQEVADADADEEREDGGYASLPVGITRMRLSLLGMDVDEVLPAIEESDEPAQAPQVFIPGSHVLEKDEILEPDDSVYIMRHSMNVNWPCLSFDILRDNLGDERQRFPATACIVAGTQADAMKNNEVVVYKLSSLYRTKKDAGMQISIWPLF